MKKENKANTSIFSAVKKLRALLTREEKLKSLGIAGFALIMSFLEIITVSVIVVFAQVLNNPSVGQTYLRRLGFAENLSPGRVVFYVAITVGAIYFIKNLVAGIEVFFQNSSIQKMCYECKNKLLHRYAQADYGFYLTRNSYFGIQLISGDVEQTFSNGLIPLLGIISELTVFTFLIGFIVYMNPVLAIALFAIGTVLSLGVSKVLLPRFYRWGKRMQKAELAAGQNLMQFFHGFKAMILCGKKDFFIRGHKVHSREKAKIQAIQFTANALPRMVIEVLFVGCFVLAISYLCLEQESPMGMIGILSGYLYGGFRLMPGLNRVINHINLFKSSVPFIERVYDECKNIVAKERFQDVPNFQFKQSIIFKGVKFSYINTNIDVLADINLEINKNECVGIVGETGSGKSTLIDLLLGLLKPTAGSILIDNQYPVNSIQWHRKIGYVPQDVYLTDGTIESNIAFGEDAIDKIKLDKAIYAAQLHKFVNALPNKEKTLVGERGIRISGGERQRIAIARALYHSPEVLIFDEATSALDNNTEARLMETIRSISKNHTVIMVAHRLSTLKDCNVIICMDKGRIAQVKTYQELANEMSMA